MANTLFQQCKKRLYTWTSSNSSTEIILIIFFAAKDGEALYSQQKQDGELTVAQTMKSLFPNSSFPAAHCPRLGLCSPPAAGGRDPGREADPAWPRAGGGSGLRCGSLPGGTWKDPGDTARPPAPSEPPFCAPAGVSRGPIGPGLGMERGRALYAKMVRN